MDCSISYVCVQTGQRDCVFNLQAIKLSHVLIVVQAPQDCNFLLINARTKELAKHPREKERENKVGASSCRKKGFFFRASLAGARALIWGSARKSRQVVFLRPRFAEAWRRL